MDAKEEQGVISPLLKIWDLHKFDKATGIPLLLRSVKVNTNNKPHPVRPFYTARLPLFDSDNHR